MNIRKIEKKDNQQIGDLVQKVLMELGAPKIGTAYSDPYLFNLFEVYSEPKTIYFVIENQGKIVGGAGIGSLENEICELQKIYFVIENQGKIIGGAGIGALENEICELQKMYFLPECRGLGLGSKLMELCLDKAKEFGYQKCYLETMHYMESAQKLYKKVGFENIDAPIGNTGHTSCPVWMLKTL